MTPGIRWPLCVMVLSAVLWGCGADRSGPAEAHTAGGGDQAVEGHEAAGHEDEGHEEGEDRFLRLTPEQFKTARIATARAERRVVTGLLEATAQIEPTGRGSARVGTRVAGRITDLRAAVGMSVRRGEVLAVVDSPELGRAKADYLAALAEDELAVEAASREQALHERRISSEKDWREAMAVSIRARAELDAAENRLHTLGVSDDGLVQVRQERHYSSSVPVVSPIDGVVAERPTTIGQMVEPADALFLVVDLRSVLVVIDVFERDLAQVRPGMEARVRVPAFPGREFRGTVESVGAQLERETRTVKVRVVMPNPAGELLLGMFASVTLAGTEGEPRERLVVPAAAVQRDGEKKLVFAAVEEGVFEPRPVETGEESVEWVEILRGVSEGETIVTEGAFLLKAEMKKGELGEGHAH